MADTNKQWFADRVWSVSGNKEDELRTANASTHRSPPSIFYPKSTDEVSSIITSNRDAAIAVVCGGHSSANASTWPSLAQNATGPRAIILDMKNLSSVAVDERTREATVGGGALLRDLAEACAAAKGALPIGTGGTVGVCGYALNGGLSGYFGKRLGMLGQRVARMEIVLADGEAKVLTPHSAGDDGDLFRACLGAGSAMGVVTSLTLRMEDESCFRTGGSLVFACSDKQTARPFLAVALRFLTRTVLPAPSVSMEIAITSDYTVICSFMFYDSFEEGTPDEFVQPLRDAAKECNVPVVADAVSSHKSWFDAASSLWDVIAGMKGDPLVRMDHCVGTREAPSEEVTDFLLDGWIGGYLEKAPQSLVEIRTLGGAMTEGSNVPSGNVTCRFFADMIVCYDGSAVDAEEKSGIKSEVHDIVGEAKAIEGLLVDFSGTHGQSDDPKGMLPEGEAIFGSAENFDLVKNVKRKVDPSNRFRFHPFGHLL